VTVAASCFSGGFTDDLEREGIKGIHISTTDNKTVAVDDFIPAFFEALGSGASVNEAFDAGFNKNNESYGSESFWNETVKEDDEGWYYKHIHLEYNETETVREYLHRRANMTDEDVTLLEKNYNETSLNQTMATFLNQTTQKEREGFYHINQTVTPYIENQTVRDYYLTTFSDRVNESTLGPAVVPISRPAGVEDITFTLKGGGTEPPEAGTEAVAPAAMEEGPRIPW